jgi:endoglucanase
MRWGTIALAGGAVAVLAGVPTAAAVLSSGHSHDVSHIVSRPAPTTTPTPTLAPSAPPPNPLAGDAFYVDPNSAALRAATQEQDAHRAALLRRIGQTPQAFWYGDWMTPAQVETAVRTVTEHAAADQRVPVLVTYDIPVRDCHGYSGGGATSPAAYRAWIDAFGSGIGTRAAVVIVEPDALAQLDCLSASNKNTRLSLLGYAVRRLARHDTQVYLDAGHAGWIDAGTMAQRLKSADVAAARGFSLNVSNFDRTSDEVAYGQAVGAALGAQTPFVIDTSRNGLGPTSDHAWCNPPGRALGTTPSWHTGQTDVDAFLWVKRPGESDGTCNGGPPAGQFWTDYAIGLAARSS